MSINPVDKDNTGDSAWERTLRQAVRGLRYGSVEVLVHDGRVVQVETREKVHFADERRPDPRRHGDDNHGRPYRNAGGAAPSPEETNE